MPLTGCADGEDERYRFGLRYCRGPVTIGGVAREMFGGAWTKPAKFEPAGQRQGMV
jgi:hypothetical protein